MRSVSRDLASVRPRSLSESVRLPCAKLLHWLNSCAFVLFPARRLSCSHTARAVHMHCDARFHSTRGLVSLHCLETTLARRQRLPVTGRTPGYIPTAALTQQAPGSRGGGRARVHWMRRADHVVGQEKKKEEGKTRLVGDCQSKKNIFMSLELWHEKCSRLGEALGSLGALLLLEQLHSVRHKSVMCCRCQEERHYRRGFREDKSLAQMSVSVLLKDAR